MKWVTRERPKTNRIACPWLISKFIDKEATFLYVPIDQVLSIADKAHAISFDAPDARFTHRDNLCTFEVLIDDYRLRDNAALVRLAQIVHAADISEDLTTDPLAAGLLAIGIGGLLDEANDLSLLAKGSFVYDALYAWCQAN
jgi:hypothetical protein